MSEVSNDQAALQTSFDQANLILFNKSKDCWCGMSYDPETMEQPIIVVIHAWKLGNIQVNQGISYQNDDVVDTLMNIGTVGESIPRDTYEMVAAAYSMHYRNLMAKDSLSVRLEDSDKGQTHRIKLWILRILMDLGANKEFVTERGFRDDKVAQFLDVAFIEEKNDLYDIDKAKYILRNKRNQLVAEFMPEWHPNFQTNLDKLSEALGLAPIEMDVFAFTILLHASSLLDDAADLLGALTSDKLYRAIGIILDYPEAEIRKALSTNGTLSRTGLIKVDRDNAQRMRSKLELLASSALDLMMEKTFEPMDLLKKIIKISDEGVLKMSDYSHFKQAETVILPYVKQALTAGIKGVNIFLYGAPGTGKTQFVKTLSHALNVPCYEVTSVDGDGDPITGNRRLGAYASAQNILKDTPCVVMFDEVEDVFVSDDYSSKSAAQMRKAWFNQLLEDNPVPAIWISNHHRGIDSAFIRRFDLVFEMPMPSKAQRISLLTDKSHGLLSAAAIDRFAKHEHLSPAMVDQACKVILSMPEITKDDSEAIANLEQIFESTVSNKLKLQRHHPLEKKGKATLPDNYNPTYMNASADMQAIALSLKEQTSARICLYGPPGTGKTAYGHYLAQLLEKPLHLKKASDLLSMYVGGTEANMAAAFESAAEEGAILLIDEVDSFISNRDNAVRSWEVTAINEMLTQMEAYEGIFIASTNRMDGLDPAALRRFDIKVKVDYLTLEQSCGLFSDHCERLALNVSEVNLNRVLAHLSYLTPGDFAAVIRQHRFRPLKSVQAFITALTEECDLKQQKNGVRIGF
jgi:transitional endoplasmic reticulum ATPase